MRITPTNFRDVARALAVDFASRAGEADKLGQLPAEDVQALKESGYLGLSVDPQFGGLGLLMRGCLAAQLELAQGSASTAMVAGMQVHIFGSAREASDSHDVYFKDVIVPPQHLLARDGDGPPPLNAWFPMVMSSVYLGSALAARNAVIKYTLERVPTALGQPIETLCSTTSPSIWPN